MFNTVFYRAITFTNWLAEEYPTVWLFADVDPEMMAEFLHEKPATYTYTTMQTLVTALRTLKEGLCAMSWIKCDIGPADWRADGDHQPRKPHTPSKAAAIWRRVTARDPEFGQALRFILSCGARIDDGLDIQRRGVHGFR